MSEGWEVTCLSPVEAVAPGGQSAPLLSVLSLYLDLSSTPSILDMR